MTSDRDGDTKEDTYNQPNDYESLKQGKNYGNKWQGEMCV